MCCAFGILLAAGTSQGSITSTIHGTQLCIVQTYQGTTNIGSIHYTFGNTTATTAKDPYHYSQKSSPEAYLPLSVVGSHDSPRNSGTGPSLDDALLVPFARWPGLPPGFCMLPFPLQVLLFVVFVALSRYISCHLPFPVIHSPLILSTCMDKSPPL